jgi:hypothetical protein
MGTSNFSRCPIVVVVIDDPITIRITTTGAIQLARAMILTLRHEAAPHEEGR